jgi:hypothetical protein
MIDAYSTGYAVEKDTSGLPASKLGLSSVVGFTRPLAADLILDDYQRAPRARTRPAASRLGRLIARLAVLQGDHPAFAQVVDRRLRRPSRVDVAKRFQPGPR